MSTADIDEYGEITEQIKTLTKRQEMLKAKLKALGEGRHDGDRYIVRVTPKTWTGLDQVKLRTYYEDAAIACETSKPYQEVTVQRKES